VRNHLRILTTSNRKEIQQIRNLQGDTETSVGLAFRRKNLLSPWQMSPKRISVQPFITAYFTYRNIPVSKDRIGLSRKALNLMMLGSSSPYDYSPFAVLSSDLATTNFKIMARWKCCCTKWCTDISREWKSSPDDKLWLRMRKSVVG